MTIYKPCDFAGMPKACLNNYPGLSWSRPRYASVSDQGDSVARFHEALQDAYGFLPFVPVPDGCIHRFHVPGDKAGSLAGWYVLYGGDISSGAFGSWKQGGSRTWHSRQPVNAIEHEQLCLRTQQARQQREAAQLQSHQEASAYASKLWHTACAASSEHPYLQAKGLQPHCLRQLNGLLLVPLFFDGTLVNLQRIHEDGTKRFLSGGKVKGACSYLGIATPGEFLYVCEGWATGATLHENTGAAVACAMNAGNLLEVGRQLQHQHPEALLVVAGDDDRLTEGNPGRTAANNAAKALGCGVVFPCWSGEEPLELSDFNDLARWRSAQ